MAEQPAAVPQHEVELQAEQYGARQVEEGDEPARRGCRSVLGAVAVGGEKQEQVQGQRGQQAARQLIAEEDQPVLRIRRRHRAEEVEEGGGQATETEKQAFAALLTDERVDTD